MKRIRLISYLVVVAVLIGAFALMGASCSVSSANIQNPVMTSAVDADGVPLDSVNAYAAGAPVYAVAELHNAPDDTKITFIWYAEGQAVDQITNVYPMSSTF